MPIGFSTFGFRDDEACKPVDTPKGQKWTFFTSSDQSEKNTHAPNPACRKIPQGHRKGLSAESKEDARYADTLLKSKKPCKSRV
jgi:hypothetical protein